MVFRILVLMLFLIACSCEAERMSPYLMYKADFSSAKTGEVESAVKKIAKEWGLRVYEKNQEQMKFLTQGKDAFFIALYFEENPILVITNAGFGDLLMLSVTDYKGMPTSDLERLAAEVINTLETRLDIKFKKSEESTAAIEL